MKHDNDTRQQLLTLLNEARQAGARQAVACEVLGISERVAQTWRKQDEGGHDKREGPPEGPAHKLSEAERHKVRELVTSPAFVDLSPKQVVAKLADQGSYLASESSIYRILREAEMNKPRGRSKPASPRPSQYVATGPNQVWSWDITYLASPVKGQFYYLYMVLDVWSRKIVGWEVHEREAMELSSELFSRLVVGMGETTLVLHSDNGGPMRGATLLSTLQSLGVEASFSRPGVSDDNPYSEAAFRTLKYFPTYPKRFASLEAAREWTSGFVSHYNFVHLHSGIGFVTPHSRHLGKDAAILQQRREVYERAARRHPARFGSGGPRRWERPEVVVLNPERVRASCTSEGSSGSEAAALGEPATVPIGPSFSHQSKPATQTSSRPDLRAGS